MEATLIEFHAEHSIYTNNEEHGAIIFISRTFVHTLLVNNFYDEITFTNGCDWNGSMSIGIVKILAERCFFVRKNVRIDDHGGSGVI